MRRASGVDVPSAFATARNRYLPSVAVTAFIALVAFGQPA
jgi:hypothetical protein